MEWYAVMGPFSINQEFIVGSISIVGTFYLTF